MVTLWGEKCKECLTSEELVVTDVYQQQLCSTGMVILALSAYFLNYSKKKVIKSWQGFQENKSGNNTNAYYLPNTSSLII